MANRRCHRIAVIGGGPAGARCARRLAERGLEVTLHEPRTAFEKACGGGIPARALDRFPELRDWRLPVKTVAGCLLIAPSGRSVAVPLREPLYIFSRGDLHRFMLDQAVEAGVRLVRRRVVGWEPRRPGDRAWRLQLAGGSDDGAIETPDDDFDYLVAADGAAGPARRRLAGGPPEREVTQGIGYYLPGLSEETIVLKFFPDLRGYLWVFPRLDHSSAGICAGLGERPAAELSALLDRFLLDRYGPRSLDGARRYAALIPEAPADPSRVRVVGDGWALVGDAGRFVDPLTREGIYFAILSGEMLAERLAQGDPSRYAVDWARAAGRELSWAARHAGGFFETRFIERLVTLCAASRTVGVIFADLIAGRQPYRGLKRRLLLNAPRVGLELARGRFGTSG